MDKEELKNKYSAFITEISEILGLGKPVDILKLCATTDLFFQPLEKRIAELEAQIEKLIDFVISKTECCDVCPITDTCINSEGTCPYAGILAKGEEEVTREWLMQFISKEIKEK